MITGNRALWDTLITHFCLGMCDSVKFLSVLVNTSGICFKLMTCRDFSGYWSIFFSLPERTYGNKELCLLSVWLIWPHHMDTVTQNKVLGNFVEFTYSQHCQRRTLIDRASLRIGALLPFQKHFILYREGQKYSPSLVDRFRVDSSWWQWDLLN